VGFIQESFGRDNGQYAQVNPEVREWFQNQIDPRTKQLCCSIADGTYAEEDIRDGHYWARWRINTWDDNGNLVASDKMTDWIQVPDGAVITNPSPNGSPVVWYGFTNGNPFIRCYVPGIKV
jgi:hypothetical protein